MVALNGIVLLLDQDTSKPSLQKTNLSEAGFSWDWMSVLGVMATRPSKSECEGDDRSTSDLPVASGSWGASNLSMMNNKKTGASLLKRRSRYWGGESDTKKHLAKGRMEQSTIVYCLFHAQPHWTMGTTPPSTCRGGITPELVWDATAAHDYIKVAQLVHIGRRLKGLHEHFALEPELV